MGNIDPKEILGFDPATGKRSEDRGGLREVQLAGTEEVGKAFVNFVDSKIKEQGEGNVKGFPPNLLMVTRGKGHVSREYFVPPEDLVFSADKVRQRVIFKADGSVFSPYFVEKFGEAVPGWEKVMIDLDYVDPQRRIPGGNNVRFWLNYSPSDSRSLREFIFTYDDSGDIRWVRFQPTPPSSDSYRWLELSTDGGLGTEMGLKALFKLGRIELNRGGVDNYVLSYDKKAGVIGITRTEKGVVKDEIEIQAKINRKKVLDDLFPAPHFDNPFETESIEDAKWKGASLATFGIKWERL